MKRIINGATVLPDSVKESYDEEAKYRNRSEYSSGFCDAIEMLAEELGIQLTARRGKSKVYDFSKINNLHIPNGAYSSFNTRTMTAEEFIQFALEQTAGTFPYNAVLEGDLDSRYCVIEGRGDVSSTDIKKFAFFNSLSEATAEYDSWLSSPEPSGRRSFGDLYNLATLLDVTGLKELMHDRTTAERNE